MKKKKKKKNFHSSEHPRADSAQTAASKSPTAGTTSKGKPNPSADPSHHLYVPFFHLSTGFQLQQLLQLLRPFEQLELEIVPALADETLPGLIFS